MRAVIFAGCLRLLRGCQRDHAFRGLVPYSVFPDTGSDVLIQGIPGLGLRLRPQGFAPSRRFAPPATCRACFIPVPLMGFTLRGFEPFLAPCSLSAAKTPRVSDPTLFADTLSTRVVRTPATSCGPALLGFCSPQKADGRVLGISPGSRHLCLLGFFPPGLLALRTGGRFTPHPLSCFFSTASPDRTVGTPGFSSTKAAGNLV
jgi:hypothetical protein